MRQFAWLGKSLCNLAGGGEGPLKTQGEKVKPAEMAGPKVVVISRRGGHPPVLCGRGYMPFCPGGDANRRHFLPR
jgi:hypothetical protein